MATADSKMIQEKGNLSSKKSTYVLNASNLKDVEQNLQDCTIRATKQGFVTYATTGRPFASQSPIQPGTSVRQYQELFNLPDFRSMGVEVKIHESSIKRVVPGLTANVRIDAFPDVALTGKVLKIALMPDPTIKFLNPDINVYLTQISLDQSMDLLKPGMTAQVEILIKELKNVIAIPVSAVSFRGSQAYCSVLDGALSERKIELGDSSDTMVEIKSGLKEGEKVVMRPGVSITSAVKKAELEERGTFREEIPSGTGTPSQGQKGVVPAGAAQGGQEKTNPDETAAQGSRQNSIIEKGNGSTEGTSPAGRTGTGRRRPRSAENDEGAVQRTKPPSEGE